MLSAPRPALHTLVKRYLEYSEPRPLRVAVGTYNINGGKHFRSIVYKDVSLSDWLLDAHKTTKESGKFCNFSNCNLCTNRYFFLLCTLLTFDVTVSWAF